MYIRVKVIYLGNTRSERPVTLFYLFSEFPCKRRNNENLLLRANVTVKRKTDKK